MEDNKPQGPLRVALLLETPTGDNDWTDSLVEGLRQAEKALSISKKMYEVGMATYLDLNNADLAYINAGLSYNQSIYEYLSSKADLEKLLGKEYGN